MPVMTERERAKRAKMVARFNAIKRQNSITPEQPGFSDLDANTSPEKNKRDPGKLDEYLTATKEEELKLSTGDESQKQFAVAHQTRTEVAKEKLSEPNVNHSESVPNKSEETACAKTKNPTITESSLKNKPTLPSAETSTEVTVSENPKTPTKSNPCAQSTPRSRRNTSLAEAKKKLAAARKASSSPKPSLDKHVLKELANKLEEHVEKCDINLEDGSKNFSQGEDMGDIDKEETLDSMNQKQSSVLVNHVMKAASEVSLTSSYWQAMSPQIAESKKGLLTFSSEEGLKQMENQLSDAQRLTVESVNSERTSSTLLSKEDHQPKPQPKVTKTWQEQAKIASKATQYRKWQQRDTPTKNMVETQINIEEYQEETKENLGTFHANMMQLWHTNDDFSSDMKGFQELGVSKDVLSTAELAEHEKSTIGMLIPEVEDSLSSKSASESSYKAARGGNSIAVKLDKSISQYKTLVPSRSDVSKYSELSLNQLTISTSDVQSDLSQKLAGEEFVSSDDKDTQLLSNRFQKSQVQKNVDWPTDAFSPTSWGGQPSSSEDSKWDTSFPNTPNSLTVPATDEEKSGWNFNTTRPVLQWEDADKQVSNSTKGSLDERDTVCSKTECDEKANVLDERNDYIHEQAMAEAEARIRELNERERDAGIKEEQYEEFREVDNADCASRMESADYDSTFLVQNDDFSTGIESKCSGGTMGTATEFDPTSMFGDVEKCDSFPTCDVDKTDASSVSWASAKVLKSNEDSTLFAFASIKAGAPMDASTLFGQDKSVVETHSGKESLGSWWKNRYASTQNNDVNAAVQEVLNETLSYEETRSENATERCASSPRCKSELATPKQPLRQGGVSQCPLRAKTNYSPKNVYSSPDNDSIFGDLDDDSVRCLKQHSASARNKLRNKNSMSKITIDDIVAEGSVNSSQHDVQKESKAPLIKSLLDGSTTTGSQSMHQTIAVVKEPMSLPCKVKDQTVKPMGLFMTDGSYGVINVKDAERLSPSGASVTSDITTSVILGGDFARKRGPSKKANSLLIEKGIPDSIIEVPDMLSDNPVCSPLNKNADALHMFEHDDTENIDPQECAETSVVAREVKDQGEMPAMTQEAVRKGNPSLLEQAILMVTNGKAAVDDSTKIKYNLGGAPSDSKGAIKPSLFTLPLACGMMGASSFAFCASKAEMTSSPYDIGQVGVDAANKHPEEDMLSAVGQAELFADAEHSNPNLTKSTSGSETVDGTTLIEEGTVADEYTLNTNERSIFDRKRSCCEEDEEEEEEDSTDDESVFTEAEEEVTDFTDVVSLSELEMDKLKGRNNKERSNKPLKEEQSRAYEKLLFYAYTALMVPLPSRIVEKSEDLDPSAISFPPVFSPRKAELRCEAMKLLLKRLGEDGMEVLKLNREKKWQPRVLTITKEVDWFEKSDDIRYDNIDCCPQGLLWVKKFNGHSCEHSVESMGRNGKGGIMFTDIKSVTVTTDKFSLSKKQKKGKFRNSFTFVLHAYFDGSKRDVLFRCCKKEDICTLSSGFQAIIDRIKNETVVVHKPLKCQQDKLPMLEDQMVLPVAIAKPFSPKTTGSDDRWEV